MNRRKLRKLKRELDGMRVAQAKAIDVQRLAKALGRRQVNRGKEPMWESEQFSELFVLSIPDHGGRDLSHGVKHSTLNQLEDDVLAWEEWLSENEPEEEKPDEDQDDDRN